MEVKNVNKNNYGIIKWNISSSIFCPCDKSKLLINKYDRIIVNPNVSNNKHADYVGTFVFSNTSIS